MDNFTYRNETNLSHIKRTQVKIELLNLQERAIGSLEGEVINGNISVNGDSAVRRTLNLVFTTTDKNYKILETHNDLSLNKKIKVYIGITDLRTSNSVKEPLWNKMGTYVMSKCTSTANVNSQQINISAQDKMCLHNGSVAGKIEYTTRLDSETIAPSYKNYISNIKEAYKDLIGHKKTLSQAVAIMKNNLTIVYKEVEGKDSYLENNVLSLMKNVNEIQSIGAGEAYDDKLQEISEGISSLSVHSRLKKIPIKDIIRYAAISLAGELPGKVVINDVPDKIKTPVIIDDKGTIGFKMISYIYPGELTLNTGQPVSEIYERCKQALGGNYEYFYDVEGNFVFQEIKNYLYNNIPKIEELKNRDYNYSFNKMPIQFDFSQYNIISSYNSSPAWENIKNDFYVWGNNNEQLIGYHLVIDDKPIIPTYVKDLTQSDNILDWREFIVHNYDIGEDRNFVGKCYIEDLPKMYHSKIGDVCCVVDKKIKAPLYRQWNGTTWVEYSLTDAIHYVNYPDYYPELKELWVHDRYEDNYERKQDVGKFNFNFDIIEGSRDLSKFSVKTIGRRKCPINDKDVKILYPTIVEDKLVYYDKEDLKYTMHPNDAIKLEKIEDFSKYQKTGNIYKSAFESIKKLLFQHTTYNEKLQITSIPVYNLEVNRRCYLSFQKTNTNGYFLLKTLNFNFSNNDIMNATFIKTNERIEEEIQEDFSNNLFSENNQPLMTELGKYILIE